MAVGNITKEVVDRLAAGPKEHCLWDTRLKGFAVKTTPNGAKSYLVQYRPGGAGTPTRRVTIGRHGAPWTPALARAEAEKIIMKIRQGVDPQEEKKVKRREAVDLAFDKYAERFLKVYGQENWSEATQSDNRRYLTSRTTHSAVFLGRKPLPEIRRADIAALLDSIPVGTPKEPKNVGLRRNLHAVLRRLFSWAVERGDIDRSPMEGFKGPKPVASRARVLSDEELRLAWLAAHEIPYPFGPLYRLLIVTGQRREEVASIDWKRLDRKAREWTLTAAETKNDKPHVVPLNELAIAALDEAAGGDEWPSKGFVFTTTGKTSVAGFSKAKTRLDEKMAEIGGTEDEPAEIEDWRIHDLRRTFATGMQRLGIRFEVTEALLNHVSGSRSGVAGIYQRHDWRDEKRTASEAWADFVATLGKAPDTSNVVAIRG